MSEISDAALPWVLGGGTIVVVDIGVLLAYLVDRRRARRARRDEPAGKPPKLLYALTLRGDERHIFVMPDGEVVMPSGARAICGKLIRYRIWDQRRWARRIPVCRECATRRPE